MCALPLAAAAFQTPLAGGLALLGLAGLGALVAVAACARDRLADVLYLALVVTVSIPIDKYFAYREHVGGWPGLRFATADFCLVALVPLAVLGWASGRTRNAVPGMVLVCYGLWLGQYALSGLAAPEKGLVVFEMASAVHALLLAVVVAALFRREYLPAILAAFAVLLVLHTGLAAVQAATGRSIGVLGAGSAELMIETLGTGVERYRPSGLFDHPIVYANFLMIVLPVVAAGWFTTRSRALRIGFGAAAVVGLAGLALTLSRGAWISSAIVAAVFVALAARYALLNRANAGRLLRVGLVAAVVTGLIFGPRIVERLTSSVTGNLRVRFELNEIALRMITAHPVAGVGLNNFIPVMEAYDPKDVMEYFPATVHNLYLLEAAEAGIPALALFLALWVAIFSTARARLPAADPELRWLAVALIAALAGFLVTQLADFSHRLEPLRSVLWVHVGLLFGALRSGRSPGSSQPGTEVS